MTRIITSLFLLFTLTVTGFSQEDSTGYDAISSVVEDCQTAAISSQTKLIQTEFYETEKLIESLEKWSTGCGEVEPIQRMRILIKINQQQLTESDYRKYIINQIEKFKDRVITSKESDYQNVYEAHEGYFSYVPLRGTFDAKTKEVAKQLLEAQEKGTAAYTFALLFSEDIDAFDAEISSEENELYEIYRSSRVQEEEDDYGDDWDGSIRLGGELGWWMPDEKLSEFFHSSPYLGIKIGGAFNDNWSVDFNANMMILIKDEDYRINVQDSIQETDSDLIFSITAAIVRTQKLSEKWFLDGSAGIGVNGMNTDIPLPVDEESEDDENEYNTLLTFDFNVGLTIRRKLQNHMLGINCTYHYTPYGLDRRLVDVFGDQSLRVGLLFMF